MTLDRILTAARQCLGTPFRHQGRRVGVGLDCAGVAVHVATQLGHEVIDLPAYGRTPAHGQLEALLEAQPCLRLIDDLPCGAKARPGDLLLMRFASDPQHLAILTDQQTIVHAYESVGACCEHRLSPTWASRIVRVYRFREMT